MPLGLGSEWSRWDLHVHTPASDDFSSCYHSSGDKWIRFIDDLESLPRDIRVIGVNDYIFLDGYKRLMLERQNGRLKNIDLILPVIELRVDKFAGVDERWSKINFHVIFTDEFTPEFIEQQFLASLSSSYQLSADHGELMTGGKWNMVITRDSIRQLGQLIIDGTPIDKRSGLTHPLSVGFSNLCVPWASVQECLIRPHFKKKYITAIGKGEWEQMNWKPNNIAEKKTLINAVDFVFTAAPHLAAALKSAGSLRENRVNERLLDCSDAHHFSDSTESNRVGKCFSWIKGEPCFEALRQASLEYEARVALSADQPLQPVNTINRIRINVPDTARIGSDAFCFKPGTEIGLSPYYTCVIGGRGTGKSMLLQLIREKLIPQRSEFFREHPVSIPNNEPLIDFIEVDTSASTSSFEILSQNEVESFARDSKKFTDAVFLRLTRLDVDEKLAKARSHLDEQIATLDERKRSIDSFYRLSENLAALETELKANQKILTSVKHETYTLVTGKLSAIAKELEQIATSKAQLAELIAKLEDIVPSPEILGNLAVNEITTSVKDTIRQLQGIFQDLTKPDKFLETLGREKELLAQRAEQTLILNKFLEAHGVSAENLRDIRASSTKVAQLEPQIPRIRQQVEVAKAAILAIPLTSEYRDEYQSIVQSMLGSVNASVTVSTAHVKAIELFFSFDEESYRRSITSEALRLLRVAEEGSFREDHLHDALHRIPIAPTTERKELVDMLEKQKTKVADALKRTFASAKWYSLFRNEVAALWMNVPRFQNVAITYGQKKIEDCSFGQRCTAVLVLLLQVGNTPLVIDEPEAHLDSTLISEYLVELIKRKKKDRQLIFATHNANFVVNGDAELIHVLGSDSQNRTTVTSTTLENLAHRDLLLALEGGKKAFARRERRYT